MEALGVRATGMEVRERASWVAAQWADSAAVGAACPRVVATMAALEVEASTVVGVASMAVEAAVARTAAVVVAADTAKAGLK